MEKQSDAVLDIASRNRVFSAHGRNVNVMDSVSFADIDDQGHVIVTASHGGRSAGEYAARILPLITVCNDAGIGKNRAGIAGLSDLDAHGVIGIGVSHTSARIGDGWDIWENGLISYVNEMGHAAGFRIGSPLKGAIETYLTGNPETVTRPAAYPPDNHAAMERSVLCELGGRRIVAMDSISIIHPDDHDQVVVAGSNGGLASGEVARKIRPAFLALNDAGIGKDKAGIAGLIEIDGTGLAAVGIGHDTAEISSGRDMWTAGFVSFANDSAARLGVRAGMTLRDAVSIWSGNR